MNIKAYKRFKQAYRGLPKNIQKKTAKQLVLLAEDMRHPSLHTKIINNPPVLPVRIKKALPFPAKRETLCSTGSTGFTRLFAPAGSRGKYCIRVAEGTRANIKGGFRYREQFHARQRKSLRRRRLCFAGFIWKPAKKSVQSCKSCRKPEKTMAPFRGLPHTTSSTGGADFKITNELSRYPFGDQLA